MNYEVLQNRINELTQNAIKAFQNHDLIDFLYFQGEVAVATEELEKFKGANYVC